MTLPYPQLASSTRPKKLSGKQLSYVSPTAEEFGTQLRGAGVPAEAIQLTAAFALAIAEGEFDFPGPDLARRLGRQPASAQDFLKQA